MAKKYLDENGLAYLWGKIKDYIATHGTGVTVDSSLSTTSENPVQNKVINTAIDSLISRVSALETKFTTYETQTSFTCTRGSSVSAGNAYGFYDALTKKVTIVGWWNSDSTITSATTLFTVPSAYRPSSNKFGMVGLRSTTQANNPRPYDIRVNSSGAIQQTLGNSIYAGSFVIEYFI